MLVRSDKVKMGTQIKEMPFNCGNAFILKRNAAKTNKLKKRSKKLHCPTKLNNALLAMMVIMFNSGQVECLEWPWTLDLDNFNVTDTVIRGYNYMHNYFTNITTQLTDAELEIGNFSFINAVSDKVVQVEEFIDEYYIDTFDLINSPDVWSGYFRTGEIIIMTEFVQARDCVIRGRRTKIVDSECGGGCESNNECTGYGNCRFHCLKAKKCLESAVRLKVFVYDIHVDEGQCIIGYNSLRYLLIMSKFRMLKQFTPNYWNKIDHIRDILISHNIFFIAASLFLASLYLGPLGVFVVIAILLSAHVEFYHSFYWFIPSICLAYYGRPVMAGILLGILLCSREVLAANGCGPVTDKLINNNADRILDTFFAKRVSRNQLNEQQRLDLLSAPEFNFDEHYSPANLENSERTSLNHEMITNVMELDSNFDYYTMTQYSSKEMGATAIAKWFIMFDVEYRMGEPFFFVMGEATTLGKLSSGKVFSDCHVQCPWDAANRYTHPNTREYPQYLHYGLDKEVRANRRCNCWFGNPMIMSNAYYHSSAIGVAYSVIPEISYTIMNISLANTPIRLNQSRWKKQQQQLRQESSKLKTDDDLEIPLIKIFDEDALDEGNDLMKSKVGDTEPHKRTERSTSYHKDLAKINQSRDRVRNIKKMYYQSTKANPNAYNKSIILEKNFKSVRDKGINYAGHASSMVFPDIQTSSDNLRLDGCDINVHVTSGYLTEFNTILTANGVSLTLMSSKVPQDKLVYYDGVKNGKSKWFFHPCRISNAIPTFFCEEGSYSGEEYWGPKFNLTPWRPGDSVFLCQNGARLTYDHDLAAYNAKDSCGALPKTADMLIDHYAYKEAKSVPMSFVISMSLDGEYQMTYACDIKMANNSLTVTNDKSNYRGKTIFRIDAKRLPNKCAAKVTIRGGDCGTQAIEVIGRSKPYEVLSDCSLSPTMTKQRATLIEICGAASEDQEPCLTRQLDIGEAETMAETIASYIFHPDLWKTNTAFGGYFDSIESDNTMLGTTLLVCGALTVLAYPMISFVLSAVGIVVILTGLHTNKHISVSKKNKLVPVLMVATILTSMVLTVIYDSLRSIRVIIQLLANAAHLTYVFLLRQTLDYELLVLSLMPHFMRILVKSTTVDLIIAITYYLGLGKDKMLLISLATQQFIHNDELYTITTLLIIRYVLEISDFSAIIPIDYLKQKMIEFYGIVDIQLLMIMMVDFKLAYASAILSMIVRTPNIVVHNTLMTIRLIGMHLAIPIISTPFSVNFCLLAITISLINCFLINRFSFDLTCNPLHYPWIWKKRKQTYTIEVESKDDKATQTECILDESLWEIKDLFRKRVTYCSKVETVSVTPPTYCSTDATARLTIQNASIDSTNLQLTTNSSNFVHQCSTVMKTCGDLKLPLDLSIEFDSYTIKKTSTVECKQDTKICTKYTKILDNNSRNSNTIQATHTVTDDLLNANKSHYYGLWESVGRLDLAVLKDEQIVVFISINKCKHHPQTKSIVTTFTFAKYNTVLKENDVLYGTFETVTTKSFKRDNMVNSEDYTLGEGDSGSPGFTVKNVCGTEQLVLCAVYQGYSNINKNIVATINTLEDRPSPFVFNGRYAMNNFDEQNLKHRMQTQNYTTVDYQLDGHKTTFYYDEDETPCAVSNIKGALANTKPFVPPLQVDEQPYHLAGVRFAGDTDVVSRPKLLRSLYFKRAKGEVGSMSTMHIEFTCVVTKLRTVKYKLSSVQSSNFQIMKENEVNTAAPDINTPIRKVLKYFMPDKLERTEVTLQLRNAAVNGLPVVDTAGRPAGVLHSNGDLGLWEIKRFPTNGTTELKYLTAVELRRSDIEPIKKQLTHVSPNVTCAKEWFTESSITLQPPNNIEAPMMCDFYFRPFTKPLYHWDKERGRIDVWLPACTGPKPTYLTTIVVGYSIKRKGQGSMIFSQRGCEKDHTPELHTFDGKRVIHEYHDGTRELFKILREKTNCNIPPLGQRITFHKNVSREEFNVSGTRLARIIGDIGVALRNDYADRRDKKHLIPQNADQAKFVKVGVDFNTVTTVDGTSVSIKRNNSYAVLGQMIDGEEPVLKRSGVSYSSEDIYNYLHQQSNRDQDEWLLLAVMPKPLDKVLIITQMVRVGDALHRQGKKFCVTTVDGRYEIETINPASRNEVDTECWVFTTRGKVHGITKTDGTGNMVIISLADTASKNIHDTVLFEKDNATNRYFLQSGFCGISRSVYDHVVRKNSGSYVKLVSRILSKLDGCSAKAIGIIDILSNHCSFEGKRLCEIDWSTIGQDIVVEFEEEQIPIRHYYDCDEIFVIFAFENDEMHLVSIDEEYKVQAFHSFKNAVTCKQLRQYPEQKYLCLDIEGNAIGVVTNEKLILLSPNTDEFSIDPSTYGEYDFDKSYSNETLVLDSLNDECVLTPDQIEIVSFTPAGHIKVCNSCGKHRLAVNGVETKYCNICEVGQYLGEPLMKCSAPNCKSKCVIINEGDALHFCHSHRREKLRVCKTCNIANDRVQLIAGQLRTYVCRKCRTYKICYCSGCNQQFHTKEESYQMCFDCNNRFNAYKNAVEEGYAVVDFNLRRNEEKTALWNSFRKDIRQSESNMISLELYSLVGDQFEHLFGGSTKCNTCGILPTNNAICTDCKKTTPVKIKRGEYRCTSCNLTTAYKEGTCRDCGGDPRICISCEKWYVGLNSQLCLIGNNSRCQQFDFSGCVTKHCNVCDRKVLLNKEAQTCNTCYYRFNKKKEMCETHPNCHFDGPSKLYKDAKLPHYAVAKCGRDAKQGIYVKRREWEGLMRNNAISTSVQKVNTDVYSLSIGTTPPNVTVFRRSCFSTLKSCFVEPVDMILKKMRGISMSVISTAEGHGMATGLKNSLVTCYHVTQGAPIEMEDGRLLQPVTTDKLNDLVWYGPRLEFEIVDKYGYYVVVNPSFNAYIILTVDTIATNSVTFKRVISCFNPDSGMEELVRAPSVHFHGWSGLGIWNLATGNLVGLYSGTVNIETNSNLHTKASVGIPIPSRIDMPQQDTNSIDADSYLNKALRKPQVPVSVYLPTGKGKSTLLPLLCGISLYKKYQKRVLIVIKNPLVEATRTCYRHVETLAERLGYDELVRVSVKTGDLVVEPTENKPITLRFESYGVSSDEWKSANLLCLDEYHQLGSNSDMRAFQWELDFLNFGVPTFQLTATPPTGAEFKPNTKCVQVTPESVDDKGIPIELLSDMLDQKTLIFQPTKAKCEEIAQHVKSHLKKVGANNSVYIVHSGQRLTKQQMDDPKGIYVGTNAVENGVTIKDLNVVFSPMEYKELDHNGYESSLVDKNITKAQAIQRAGRAGRRPGSKPIFYYEGWVEKQTANNAVYYDAITKLAAHGKGEMVPTRWTSDVVSTINTPDLMTREAIDIACFAIKHDMDILTYYNLVKDGQPYYVTGKNEKFLTFEESRLVARRGSPLDRYYHAREIKLGFVSSEEQELWDKQDYPYHRIHVKQCAVKHNAAALSAAAGLVLAISSIMKMSNARIIETWSAATIGSFLRTASPIYFEGYTDGDISFMKQPFNRYDPHVAMSLAPIDAPIYISGFKSKVMLDGSVSSERKLLFKENAPINRVVKGDQRHRVSELTGSTTQLSEILDHIDKYPFYLGDMIEHSEDEIVKRRWFEHLVGQDEKNVKTITMQYGGVLGFIESLLDAIGLKHNDGLREKLIMLFNIVCKIGHSFYDDSVAKELSSSIYEFIKELMTNLFPGISTQQLDFGVVPGILGALTAILCNIICLYGSEPTVGIRSETVTTKPMVKSLIVAIVMGYGLIRLSLSKTDYSHEAMLSFCTTGIFASLFSPKGVLYGLNTLSRWLLPALFVNVLRDHFVVKNGNTICEFFGNIANKTCDFVDNVCDCIVQSSAFKGFKEYFIPKLEAVVELLKGTGADNKHISPNVNRLVVAGSMFLGGYANTMVMPALGIRHHQVLQILYCYFNSTEIQDHWSVNWANILGCAISSLTTITNAELCMAFACIIGFWKFNSSIKNLRKVIHSMLIANSKGEMKEAAPDYARRHCIDTDVDIEYINKVFIALVHFFSPALVFVSAVKFLALMPRVAKTSMPYGELANLCCADTAMAGPAISWFVVSWRAAANDPSSKRSPLMDRIMRYEEAPERVRHNDRMDNYFVKACEAIYSEVKNLAGIFCGAVRKVIDAILTWCGSSTNRCKQWIREHVNNWLNNLNFVMLSVAQPPLSLLEVKDKCVDDIKNRAQIYNIIDLENVIRQLVELKTVVEVGGIENGESTDEWAYMVGSSSLRGMITFIQLMTDGTIKVSEEQLQNEIFESAEKFNNFCYFIASLLQMYLSLEIVSQEEQTSYMKTLIQSFSIPYQSFDMFEEEMLYFRSRSVLYIGGDAIYKGTRVDKYSARFAGRNRKMFVDYFLAEQQKQINKLIMLSMGDTAIDLIKERFKLLVTGKNQYNCTLAYCFGMHDNSLYRLSEHLPQFGTSTFVEMMERETSRADVLTNLRYIEYKHAERELVPVSITQSNNDRLFVKYLEEMVCSGITANLNNLKQHEKPLVQLLNCIEHCNRTGIECQWHQTKDNSGSAISLSPAGCVVQDKKCTLTSWFSLVKRQLDVLLGYDSNNLQCLYTLILANINEQKLLSYKSVKIRPIRTALSILGIKNGKWNVSKESKIRDVNVVLHDNMEVDISKDPVNENFIHRIMFEILITLNQEDRVLFSLVYKKYVDGLLGLFVGYKVLNDSLTILFENISFCLFSNGKIDYNWAAADSSQLQKAALAAAIFKSWAHNYEYLGQLTDVQRHPNALRIINESQVVGHCFGLLQNNNEINVSINNEDIKYDVSNPIVKMRLMEAGWQSKFEETTECDKLDAISYMSELERTVTSTSSSSRKHSDEFKESFTYDGRGYGSKTPLDVNNAIRELENIKFTNNRFGRIAHRDKELFKLSGVITMSQLHDKLHVFDYCESVFDATPGRGGSLQFVENVEVRRKENMLGLIPIVDYYQPDNDLFKLAYSPDRAKRVTMEEAKEYDLVICDAVDYNREVKEYSIDRAFVRYCHSKVKLGGRFLMRVPPADQRLVNLILASYSNYRLDFQHNLDLPMVGLWVMCYEKRESVISLLGMVNTCNEVCKHIKKTMARIQRKEIPVAVRVKSIVARKKIHTSKSVVGGPPRAMFSINTKFSLKPNLKDNLKVVKKQKASELKTLRLSTEEQILNLVPHPEVPFTSALGIGKYDVPVTQTPEPVYVSMSALVAEASFGINDNTAIISRVDTGSQAVNDSLCGRLGNVPQVVRSQTFENEYHKSMLAVCDKEQFGKFGLATKEEILDLCNYQGAAGKFEGVKNVIEYITKYPNWFEEIHEYAVQMAEGDLSNNYVTCLAKRETKLSKGIENDRIVEPDKEKRRTLPRIIQFNTIKHRLMSMYIIGKAMLHHYRVKKLYAGSTTGTPFAEMGDKLYKSFRKMGKKGRTFIITGDGKRFDSNLGAQILGIESQVECEFFSTPFQKAVWKQRARGTCFPTIFTESGHVAVGAAQRLSGDYLTSFGNGLINSAAQQYALAELLGHDRSIPVTGAVYGVDGDDLYTALNIDTVLPAKYKNEGSSHLTMYDVASYLGKNGVNDYGVIPPYLSTESGPYFNEFCSNYIKLLADCNINIRTGVEAAFSIHTNEATVDYLSHVYLPVQVKLRCGDTKIIYCPGRSVARNMAKTIQSIKHEVSAFNSQHTYMKAAGTLEPGHISTGIEVASQKSVAAILMYPYDKSVVDHHLLMLCNFGCPQREIERWVSSHKFSQLGIVKGTTFRHDSTILRVLEKMYGVEVNCLDDFQRADCSDLSASDYCRGERETLRHNNTVVSRHGYFVSNEDEFNHFDSHEYCRSKTVSRAINKTLDIIELDLGNDDFTSLLNEHGAVYPFAALMLQSPWLCKQFKSVLNKRIAANSKIVFTNRDFVHYNNAEIKNAQANRQVAHQVKSHWPALSSILLDRHMYYSDNTSHGYWSQDTAGLIFASTMKHFGVTVNSMHIDGSNEIWNPIEECSWVHLRKMEAGNWYNNEVSGIEGGENTTFELRALHVLNRLYGTARRQNVNLLSVTTPYTTKLIGNLQKHMNAMDESINILANMYRCGDYSKLSTMINECRYGSNVVVMCRSDQLSDLRQGNIYNLLTNNFDHFSYAHDYLDSNKSRVWVFAVGKNKGSFAHNVNLDSRLADNMCLIPLMLSDGATLRNNALGSISQPKPGLVMQLVREWKTNIAEIPCAKYASWAPYKKHHKIDKYEDRNDPRLKSMFHQIYLVRQNKSSHTIAQLQLAHLPSINVGSHFQIVYGHPNGGVVTGKTTANTQRYVRMSDLAHWSDYFKQQTFDKVTAEYVRQFEIQYMIESKLKKIKAAVSVPNHVLIRLSRKIPVARNLDIVNDVSEQLTKMVKGRVIKVRNYVTIKDEAMNNTTEIRTASDYLANIRSKMVVYISNDTTTYLRDEKVLSRLLIAVKKGQIEQLLIATTFPQELIKLKNSYNTRSLNMTQTDSVESHLIRHKSVITGSWHFFTIDKGESAFINCPETETLKYKTTDGKSLHSGTHMHVCKQCGGIYAHTHLKSRHKVMLCDACRRVRHKVLDDNSDDPVMMAHIHMRGRIGKILHSASEFVMRPLGTKHIARSMSTVWDSIMATRLWCKHVEPPDDPPDQEMREGVNISALMCAVMLVIMCSGPVAVSTIAVIAYMLVSLIRLFVFMDRRMIRYSAPLLMGACLLRSNFKFICLSRYFVFLSVCHNVYYHNNLVVDKMIEIVREFDTSTLASIRGNLERVVQYATPRYDLICMLTCTFVVNSKWTALFASIVDVVGSITFTPHDFRKPIGHFIFLCMTGGIDMPVYLSIEQTKHYYHNVFGFDITNYSHTFKLLIRACLISGAYINMRFSSRRKFAATVLFYVVVCVLCCVHFPQLLEWQRYF